MRRGVAWIAVSAAERTLVPSEITQRVVTARASGKKWNRSVKRAGLRARLDDGRSHGGALLPSVETGRPTRRPPRDEGLSMFLRLEGRRSVSTHDARDLRIRAFAGFTPENRAKEIRRFLQSRRGSPDCRPRCAWASTPLGATRQEGRTAAPSSGSVLFCSLGWGQAAAPHQALRRRLDEGPRNPSGFRIVG